MLLNYLRITFRTFFKNKTAFAINLVGLSIALGCCITAYVNFEFSSGFDQQQKNADHIYRISFWQQKETKKIPFGVCPIPVGNLIRENLRTGEQLIQYISKDAQFRIGDELFQRQFIYADPAFTQVFSMDLLHGTLSLTDKKQILISDELAKTYFGTNDVVGKTLIQVMAGGSTRDFEISGVFKRFQANSSFRFDLLSSYENYFIDPSQRSTLENDWSRWSTTFLYLNDQNFTSVIEKQLQQFVTKQNEARPDLQVSSFYVEPFVGMAGRALKERNQGHWLNMPMPPAAVIAPFVMAAFLLLVACFNFMNNAIAVAGNRLKEIGIRKAVGGKRRELIIQFLSETFVFCLLSMGFALVLAEYFVDGWNGMWGGIEIAIHYRDNVPLFTVLVVLMMMTALIAGGYPAFYISSFKPIEILRGTVRFGSTNLLTKSLLVFQFTISLAAVIFAIAFYFNSKFQREYDLGYAWRSVIQVPLENSDQFELLRNEIEGAPLIQSVGGSQNHIYSSSYKAAARSGNQIEKEVDMLNVGDNYFETLSVSLMEGRSFAKDQASDVKESIVVNEEFVRVFGLGKSGIGQRVLLNDSVPVYIIGVVKDVYLGALFQPLSALAFRYVPQENYRYLVASTDPANLSAANAQIRQAWKKVFPASLYPGQLMEYRMVMALEHFDSVVILYTFLGLVAIIMSISGLYGLVSLNLQRRTKELGIRKILGAPLLHIIVQSSKLFIVIMSISFVLGSLMGSVMVNALMDSVWEYYVAVNTTVLILAILILLVIAVTTIGYKIRMVVVANPVDALKQE